MATTSTPSLNRPASAALQGAESDHSPALAEAAAEHRPDQTAMAGSHGYGESPETEGIQTSDNDLPLVPDALKAERRRSNQLEKEIRSLKQQLNRFSEINPEEYTRLQEAEKQKQQLEQQLELRERQMEEASARKVAAIAAERDSAAERVLQLRKERLLERAFSEAEGRTGGDGRGTFFDVFKGQLWESFRLVPGKDGSDGLEPLDAQGQPLLGDDGRPLTASEFLEDLRVHPVYGFLFQQRGAMGGPAAVNYGTGTVGSNGELINPQAMSAAELYRAGFGAKTTSR
jgi:hypothetical protein